MSTLILSKYEGAGNDFILIDDRLPHFPTGDTDLIRRLCSRKIGLGADGILLLQLDPSADVRMRVFNSDGSEPAGCGNGLRCLVRFIADLGLPKKSYRIRMGKRIVKADFAGDKISVEMGFPEGLKLGQQIGPWEVHTVDTGVPHAVVFVPDVEKIDLMKEAPFLRHHPLFAPSGTNVNFATVTQDIIHVRSFERGVEGETLSCGTGAAAVAWVAARLFSMRNPIVLRFPGGDLEARLDPLTLVGSANRLLDRKNWVSIE